MKENIEENIKRISNLIGYIENADYVDASQCFDAEDIQAIDHIISDYKRVLKKNEELNNRCRNLDKEAQAYLEELAGDNTLTRRTIKQLQEENEECKLDVQDYLKQAQENAKMYRKAQKKIQDLKAENEELKEDNKHQWKERCRLTFELENSIPVQKENK